MVVGAAVPYMMVVFVLDITDAANTAVVEVRVSCAHAVQNRQHSMQLLDTVGALASILLAAPEVVGRPFIVNMIKFRAPFHIVQV